MEILESQKVKLLNHAISEGYNPDSFTFNFKIDTWNNIKWTNVISYRESDYFFKIHEFNSFFDRSMWLDSKKQTCEYSPWENAFIEKFDIKDFDHILKQFKRWLLNLNREHIASQDIFKLLSESLLKEWLFKNWEEMFSKKEKSIVATQITNAKNILAQEWNYESSELEVINEKLDYTIQKVEELNKADWKNLFLWTVMSIIIQCAFWPEWAVFLWSTLQQEFSSKFLW